MIYHLVGIQDVTTSTTNWSYERTWITADYIPPIGHIKELGLLQIISLMLCESSKYIYHREFGFTYIYHLVGTSHKEEVWNTDEHNYFNSFMKAI